MRLLRLLLGTTLLFTTSALYGQTSLVEAFRQPGADVTLESEADLSLEPISADLASFVEPELAFYGDYLAEGLVPDFRADLISMGGFYQAPMNADPLARDRAGIDIDFEFWLTEVNSGALFASMEVSVLGQAVDTSAKVDLNIPPPDMSLNHDPHPATSFLFKPGITWRKGLNDSVNIMMGAHAIVGGEWARLDAIPVRPGDVVVPAQELRSSSIAKGYGAEIGFEMVMFGNIVQPKVMFSSITSELYTGYDRENHFVGIGVDIVQPQ